MRRSFAVALVLATGASVLTACTGEPSPSDVAVAWSGAGKSSVRVTWKDGNAPNRITIEGVLSEGPSYVHYLPAEQDNSWDIPTSAFPPDGNYRVVVMNGTTKDGLTGKPAKSPVFDTDGPVRPSSAFAVAQGRGVLIRWTVPPAPQDFTPHDPLDVEGTKVQKYVPMIGKPGTQPAPIGPGTTSARQVINSIQPPFLFQLRTENEWSSNVGGQVVGLTSSATVFVPPKAQYSLPMRVRGRVVLQETYCAAEAACALQQTTSAGIPLTVLTQVTPKARWSPVAHGKTTAGGHFDIPVVTAGSRPYKVVASRYAKPGVLTGESSSPAVFTRGVVRLLAGGYLGGNNKKRGEMVTVFARVAPAYTSAATLQLWNRQSRKWVSVKLVALRRGQAVFGFKVNAVGTYSYRWVLPQAASGGRNMDGLTTPALDLRIRP
ncbi:hypothetical protein ACIA49_08540 [Kribbella sp. NPDC051587]|uniref:hypothetical protein n=1 Tax=Kribbella sp. NPDC051587 TaxID=3364119 RepID=UPI0037A69DCC